MTYLVTGTAGFNSNFITPQLYRQGHDVIGLSNHKGSQINVSDPIDSIKQQEPLYCSLLKKVLVSDDTSKSMFLFSIIFLNKLTVMT